MQVRDFYPYTLQVDGDEIRLQIKRMDVDEWGWFSMGFSRISTPTVQRFVHRDPNDAYDMRTDDAGEFVESLEDLTERKRLRLGEERRRELHKAEDEDDAHAREFVKRAFAQFVVVAGGLSRLALDGSEEPITKGLEFVRTFAARRDVLQEVLTQLYMQNTLGEDQKKALQSLTDSARTLRERSQAAIGSEPATTAQPAETPATVPPADVSSPPATLSLPAAVSQSDPVQS